MSRTAITLTMLVSCALVAEPACRDSGPAFTWNASASAPIGLYRLAPVSRVEAPDLVVVAPPAPLASFLAERGYLPRGVPLIKRVLAVAGDAVCRHGTTIVAFDHVYGEARATDSLSRPLPIWQGCRTLAEGEVFLMNWDAADSFDGRYFGPLPVTSIVARALPLWTDTEGDGRFHWHVGDPLDAH
ncbi:S26 family signal peptidase [Mesorhizobium sp.]|uniref:S26 family signal peptidase n=1 Tax=Mesorhizobium sp. TaxID=1871066 RepID=UPI000FE4CA50|nr:S26 family signal peptidase [Mesorhizobium sp.]RWJ31974.1 MAG: S26 family signal peptidase [Mesorhizobium sp.]TIQ73820.1 MAG: S26 family signal peptidase [Mesorhizobium sp.]